MSTVDAMSSDALETRKNLPVTIEIERLLEPTPEIVERFAIWENDPEIIPYIRPISSEKDLQKKKEVTVETLRRRLETHEEYLIYLDGKPIGQLSVQIDPGHLAKRVKGTAWIGIYIGEKRQRGKGAGTFALQRVESILKSRGVSRIELGVFEFNKAAYRLYKRLGYSEFTRLDELAWWNGSMWRDIRMEKYLEQR
jgi:RimJ/RimL family protein N-acetyltransferase